MTILLRVLTDTFRFRFLAVGSGVLYLVKVESTTLFLVSTQILVGLGVGPLLQTPIICVQANSDMHSIALETGVVSFMQRLGGTLGVSM